MKPSVGVVVVLVSNLCLAIQLAAVEPIRSGLQPGQEITTIFEPLNLNGDYANQPHCLVCENGLCPVVMVLARDLNAPLLKLLARLDKACVLHAKDELGGFAVFLDASDPLTEKLRAAAASAELKKIVLATEAETQVAEYRAAAEAEVTVMLYVRHQVKANFAFRTGELNDAAIEKIVSALPQILDVK